GPWLPASGGTLTITADGDQQVMNPGYSGPFTTPGKFDSQRNVTRHYGFGSSQGNGTVKLGDATLAVQSWGDQSIVVTVPAAASPYSAQLHISTDAGVESVDTVTVTVGGKAPTRVSNGGSIQSAIDAAAPGDLILVDAGTYNELVIMWKPVRLQGVGASSVIINAAKFPNAKLEGWRPRINGLFAIDAVTGNQTGLAQVDPLPTQEITGGVVILEPSVLGSEEGAGITVLAKNLPARDCRGGRRSTIGQRVTDSNFWCAPSRIDGISVTGGDAGGGIYVNGWAHNLEIANNRVFGNAGAYNGGIRVGVPYLELDNLPNGRTKGRINGLGYDNGINIHHNAVTKNGTVEAPAGLGGAGGGISICSGTDAYKIDHNYVCGNFTSSDGGGIGHLGFSQGGTITNNKILFNQSFQQTTASHGGGIVLEGEPPVAGGVSLGTGDVTIDSNLIRGNFAEGGQGGGIRLQQVNGADVSGNDPKRWHHVVINNNMIVNNVAGWAGGGIAMGDALNVSITNTTIASNDTAGTAGVLLAQHGGQGVPTAAGIVSELTTAALLARAPGNPISQPELANDILWQNRSFWYSGDGRVCVGNSPGTPASCATLPNQSTTGQCVGDAAYWDLGVITDTSATPGALRLKPTSSVLTSTTGYAGNGNTSTNPNLTSLYCNGARVMPEMGPVANPPGVNNVGVINFIAASTADEANNYVSFRYGPLYVENPQSKTSFGYYSAPK
ncbi:MAG: multicopper oxidase type 3, partial [bacterium]|nr:multicopper oxidase type 3 [bacterium]